MYKTLLPHEGIAVASRSFLDLALDSDELRTPDGVIPLEELTRAELVRHRDAVSDRGQSTSSIGAVAGGALIGGVLAGPLGALAGAALGSGARYQSTDSGSNVTRSATLFIESSSVSYSTGLRIDQIADAQDFINAVHDRMRQRPSGL